VSAAQAGAKAAASATIMTDPILTDVQPPTTMMVMMIATGCMTVTLLGAFLVIRREANLRRWVVIVNKEEGTPPTHTRTDCQPSVDGISCFGCFVFMDAGPRVCLALP
jgi:hypothetical protein